MPVEDVIIDEQPFLYIQGANDPLPTQSTGSTGDGLLFESGTAATLTALAAASSVAAGNLFYIVQGGAPKSLDYTVLLSSLSSSIAATYLPLAGGTMSGGLIIEKNGSDTELLGPYVRLKEATGTNYDSLWQLGATGSTDIWTFNPATGLWKKSFSMAYTGGVTITTNNAALNWDTLKLTSSVGTSPGLQFLSDNANAGTRNWGIATDRITFGDINFLESAAKGGDPMDSGTALLRLRLVSGGAVLIPGTLGVTGAVTALNIVLTQTVLTYAATTDIDFDLAGLRTLALTGNVTFTTSNRGSGKTVTIKILCDATPRTFTFPAWKWVGTVPTGIAANKTGILSVSGFGSADTDVVAAYAVEA